MTTRVAFVSALLFVATFVFAEELHVYRIRGIVTDAEHNVLPGVTVALTNRNTSRITVADENGRYAFATVFPGEYELAFKLQGFESGAQRITVDGDVEVPAQQLSMTMRVETIVTCGAACQDAPAQTSDELPQCAEFEINSRLIADSDNGDPSVLRLLQQRFESTVSHYERSRIAAALLGRVSDDRKYWNALEELAEIAVRYPYVNNEPSAAYVAWCEAHDVGVETHRNVIEDALRTAARDPRAKPLLLRALATSDATLVGHAIYGFALTRDASLLPRIREAIKRLPEAQAEWLSRYLGGIEAHR